MEIIIVGLLIFLIVEVAVMNDKLPKVLSGKDSEMLIDTSVLMDGRIVAVAQSGFVSDTVLIPRSVVGELQLLADGSDSDKRTRARHGLDVINILQNDPNVKVKILQDGSRADEGVDERLLKLAKVRNAKLCTIDFNLNKVAQVEGVKVCNVNELAQSLRMAHLPGEHMTLQLVQKGQDNHQAVGYIADGTMVVVEHASNRIGHAEEVEVIRSLQTAAGKMMFAKLVDGNHQNKNNQNNRNISQVVKTSKKLVSGGRKQKPSKPVAATITPPVQADIPKKPASSSHKKPQSNKKRRTSADREAALIELVEKSNLS